MSHHRRRALVLLAFATLTGCGADPEPQPDSNQLRALVHDFFLDAAAGDAEAVCAVLTPDGRARATERRFVHGRPLRPASEEQCVSERAPAALKSSDLPIAVKNGWRHQVVKLRLVGVRARARIQFTGFFRSWRFRKSDGDWRIDYFSMPVRE